MTKIEPRLLKGFRDYSLEEQSGRQAMFAKIQTVFEQFGFLPLSTPVLEYKDILMGKYGDDQKLVYSFQDHGDRDVAMRYDLTVPLARYVAQNQGKLTFPFKRYQIAPVWRADNPQKGRLREFYQCDVDVVGSDSVLSDIEVIACAGKTIEALGIVNYTFRISDREILKDFSPDTIRIIDKVEKIGMDAAAQEMQERGISEKEIALAKKLVEGTGIVPTPRLQQVLDGLKDYNLKGSIQFDPKIARGLEYYSGTVYETVIPDKPEYGSICSGGRYDGLLSQYSNTSLPAVGISLGIDRLYDAMQELNLIPTAGSADVLILNLEHGLQAEYSKLASMLRDNGFKVELYYEPVKLDKQFKYGEKKAITWAVVMGEAEHKAGMVKVKNMTTREQTDVAITELSATLK